ESIETAEDRKLFAAMLYKLGLRQTPNGSATSTEEAVVIAKKIGYPVLVRPSFVLGGRGMELVYNEQDLRRYVANALEVADREYGFQPASAGGHLARRSENRRACSPAAESSKVTDFRSVRQVLLD